MDEFTNAPYFYSTLENHKGIPTDVSILLETPTKNLDEFTNYLWFAKDNSIHVAAIYCFLDSGFCVGRLGGFIGSNSRGEYEAVLITRSDLELATKIFNKVLEIEGTTKEVSIARNLGNKNIAMVVNSDFHYIDYNKNNRILRALTFLHLARGASFLPLKISFYAALLECLFTTDTIELSHKISERASHYMGGTPQEKLDNYKHIKAAYNTRSGFLHGQKISNSDRKVLAEISFNIDNIIRTILSDVIFKDSETFKKENTPLEEYYTKLVFQVKPSI
jgi:hypothetical protein